MYGLTSIVASPVVVSRAVETPKPTNVVSGNWKEEGRSNNNSREKGQSADFKSWIVGHKLG